MGAPRGALKLGEWSQTGVRKAGKIEPTRVQLESKGESGGESEESQRQAKPSTLLNPARI